jgi:hypothetical protein
LYLFLLSLLLISLWPDSSADAQSKAVTIGQLPVLSPKSAPKESKAKTEEASKPATPAFPGLAEVVPNEAQLSKAAAEVKERIAAAWDMTTLNAEIADCEVRHEKVKELIGRMGDPENWDFGRLTDARTLILKERRQIEALVTVISTELTELDTFRDDWENKQRFWQEWRKSLQAANVELPTETFDKAQESASSILQNISSTARLLIANQQKASMLLAENLKVGAQIEAAQTRLRDETFKKIEPSFFTEPLSKIWPTS